ncbi:hypothetical protein P3L10_014126 [Capsicum annuum]
MKARVVMEMALSMQVHADGGAAVSDIFDTKDIASLGRPGIENLLKLEIEVSRGATFASAMEGSYIELVEKLANAAVKTANFRADGEQKAWQLPYDTLLS